jgi:NIPSNAP protein
VKRLVEIRAYALKANTVSEFHEMVKTAAIPLLQAFGMDVVAFGPSAHDENAYFLIRAFDDLAHLQSQQDAFYGSAPWLSGPREAIISRIESYLSTVVWLSPESIDDLRRSNGAAAQRP